jgi:SAM-dependent methyltransferase
VKEELMGAVESMRREWDARARKDAFFYIASWRKDWNVAEFLKSGEEDYECLVAPVLDRFGFSPEGKTMLELGCGAGRMTHIFASHFGRVIALDLSPEMLERARNILAEDANVSWTQANGNDLGDVASESVDFSFSYLVLQHLPAESLVQGYIGEMLRALKENGICLFQFNAMERPTMNWKGRFAWGCVNALWTMRLSALSRSFAKRLGFDPEMAGKTWHGTAIPTANILAAVKASGGGVLEFWGDGTPMAWCCARKQPLHPLKTSA